MEMLAAWVLFPLVLAALSLGCGLLLDRVTGGGLPGALLAPAGFALLLTLGNLIAFAGSLGGLGMWVLLGVALAGYVAGRGRLSLSAADRWPAAVAVGIFLVFAGPALLSGEPTLSGPLVLPDTSNQLILADHTAKSGVDYKGLAESSRQSTVAKYLSTEYPVGAQATLGLLAPLGVLDMIWLYQPFLSFVAAMTALALYELLAPWVARRALRAGAAFLAGQSALVLSFALQGSIKEMSAASAVYLLAALLARALGGRWDPRALPAVVVAATAATAALGPAALAYVAPLLLVAGIVALTALRKSGWRPGALDLRWGAAAILLGLVLAIPLLSGLSQAYQVNSGTLSLSQDLGNLAAPLNLGQISGVWLGEDFRYVPRENRYLNFALIGLVLGAAALGVGWVVRRRAVGPLLVLLGVGLVSVYLLRRGSPYADAKVMMIVSPTVLLMAALGVGALARVGRRPVEAALLGAVLASGVLGSNALAYHNVQNAPHERYSELLDINERFSGQGPALFTEYDEYAGYLLRDMRPFSEPEYAHGFRGPPDREPSGLFDPRHRPSVKSPLDLDDLTIGYVQSVPTVVLRRSPTVSRPPANFRRVWRGRYYEVWRRAPESGRVVAHLPLGDYLLTPAGVPDCTRVAALARRAERVGGRLAYVLRENPVTVDLTRDESPPRAWASYTAYPQAFVPVGPGIVEVRTSLATGARVRVWLEGSFSRGVEVEIDGRRVGGISYEPGNAGQYLELGRLSLVAGPHRVRVVRGGGDLRPGNGGAPQAGGSHIGPLVLSPRANEARKVETADPRDARSLCGRSLDWVEVVVPSAAG